MSSERAAWSAGTVVGDRYRIEALLGEGGYGAVYRATQLALGRAVALKALRPELTAPDALARFEEEAALAQKLQHPNTVRLLDFGRSAEGAPFLVFELLEGRTLDAAIRGGGALADARVARIAAQILKGLMEAHRLGIVHRDVKPANVFLCEFAGEPDFVKLLDFGIAKRTGGRALTQRGEVVGTPGYVAPELLREAQAGPRADLYAVGMVMAEARLGRAIFEGVPWEKLALDLLTDDPLLLPPAALAPPLGAVIARATQKQPEARYADAAEMLAALEACVAVPAPPPPAPPPPPRRRRWPWVAAALLLLAGGGAAAALHAGVLPPLPVAKPAPPPKVWSWSWSDEQEMMETSINDDAVPDLVTLCTDDRSLSLCGIDGATLKPVWTTLLRADEPYGSHLLVTVAGRSALVIDASGTVTFHDVRTGAKTGALKLGQRARRLCGQRGGPPAVWVETERQQRLRVDVEARSVGATLPREQIAPCKRRGIYVDTGIARVDTGVAVIDGSDGVFLGSERDAYSIQMLVGFSPDAGGRTGPERWRRPIASDHGLGGTIPNRTNDVELTAGRAFAVYHDLVEKDHVVAVNAVSGKQLWDVKLTERLAHLSAGKTRVYVGGHQRLDVLDAATGKHLGMFGKATPGAR